MKRILSFLSVLLCVTLTIPTASALGELPPVNEQPRHEVCTALSDAARAYYTGDYAYESLCALSGSSDNSTGYTAMQDNELFTVLHTLMTSTHFYYTSYSGYGKSSLAYFWKSTDAVDSSNTFVMFYSDVAADADESIMLNREHIWPKSRASFNEKNGGADLHHLRPAVDSLNRAKSNHAFGNIQGVYTEGFTEGSVLNNICYWVHKDDDLFECKDDVKGDVARILLYVYCRWEQPNLYADVPAELLPENEADSTDSGVKVIESLDTLLTWCAEDPVDTWEMRRNDLVESVQGNRNVFIDYPELAWRLFGEEIPEEMPTPSSQDRSYLLGDADGDGEVTVVDATMIQRTLAHLYTSAFNESAADVDGDGEIAIYDAVWILRFSAQMDTPYPIGERVEA